jgi:ATP-dependent Clp protease adaptor protein ClpS
MTSSSPQTGTEIDMNLMMGPQDPWQLILWNDNVNTFDHVTSTLTQVLNIPAGRAVTLALDAHITGKATLTDGEHEAMLQLAHTLGSAQLSVSVEQT